MHDDAELWAAAAVTGALTDTEFKAWSDHLRVCPTCNKLNAEGLAMADLVQSTLEPQSPDPGFEQRIIQRLNQERVGNRWYEFLLFHPGLTLAATCLVAAAVVGAVALLDRHLPLPTGAVAQTPPGELIGPAQDAVPSEAGKKFPDTVLRAEKDREVANVVGAEATARSESDDHRAEASALPAFAVATGTPDTVSPDRRNAVNLLADRIPPDAVKKAFDEGEAGRIASSLFGADRKEDVMIGDGQTTFHLEPIPAEKVLGAGITGNPKVEWGTADGAGLRVVTLEVGAPHHHHHHRHHHHHHRHHHRHHHPPAPPKALEGNF